MISSTTPTRQGPEQRHPLAQSRLEGDLAAHGALGDRRDLRPSGRHSRRARRCIPARSWSNPCRPGTGACGGSPAGWTTTSTGLPSSAARRLASTASASPAPATSQIGRDSPCENRAFRSMSERRGRAGATSASRDGLVETGWRRGSQRGLRGWTIVRKPGCEGGDRRGPHRRADRFRQVGPRRSSWRTASAASVINANSMQVYRDLRILTARPTGRGGRGRAPPALRPCGRRR